MKNTIHMENNDRNKLEKMLILMKHMTNNDRLNVTELAKLSHISYRSVYRYIETFENAGFVVTKKGAGIYSLATIGKKFVDFSKLVMFTNEEAFVVRTLISSLEETNGFKEELMKKLSAVYESKCIADFVVNKSTTKQVTALNEAIQNRRRVILKDYESGHSETTTDRLVEPFKLAPNFESVHTYEVETGMCKVFRVNRIRDVEVLPDKWEFERFYHYDEPDAFRMTGPTLIPVKLELSILAKNLLIEEYPLAAKDIHRTSTGKWILNTKVRDLTGIGRFVVGLADRVTIIKAPELVEYLKGFTKSIDRLVR